MHLHIICYPLSSLPNTHTHHDDDDAIATFYTNEYEYFCICLRMKNVQNFTIVVHIY